MSFSYDETWLMEAVRIEEECNCDISAGYDLGSNVGKFYASVQNGDALDFDKVAASAKEALSHCFSDEEIDSLMAQFKSSAQTLLMQKLDSNQSV
ncbi:hypothetical protein Pse7367_1524 [Thalassoporum mexicanum PCC 7367]|uniref:hypothetical protein n=1 Tax=Thalassoporum mexicanum TaxID=3457544 RepID=UPI00029FCA40|nr:hypothetical protein [Pseudanabaena sp. PCC 7367]AFY69813.1 hypothetical protein Pse7367_1524 [Pseudanabaena sp. PCC 7367]